MAKRTGQAMQNRPPTHQEDPIITMTEAADQLGKTSTTIKRWMMDGLLLGVRLPSGRLAVRQSSVDNVLETYKANKVAEELAANQKE